MVDVVGRHQGPSAVGVSYGQEIQQRPGAFSQTDGHGGRRAALEPWVWSNVVVDTALERPGPIQPRAVLRVGVAGCHC